MVRRLAILTEPESAEVYVRALQAATSSLGLQLMELSVSSSDDVEWSGPWQRSRAGRTAA